LLAKAAAGSISKLHGKQAADTGYIYVKGPEVLSKWVGESESTIRGLFLLARNHKAKHGYPAILFVDECESLLSKRGTGLSSDVNNTIVPAFLAELDGLVDSGAMVILATNRPDKLDPAVVREGRIDRRIRVARPDQSDAAQVFAIYLKRVPSCPNPEEVAEHASKHLFSEATGLVRLTTSTGETFPFHLGHLASGAMIEGIVDRATSLVLHEAIEGDHGEDHGRDKGIVARKGKREPTEKSVSGTTSLNVGELTLTHVHQASHQVAQIMQSVDYSEDIKLWASQTGVKITAITQVHS
jgi:proteasome-associated ATPase